MNGTKKCKAATSAGLAKDIAAACLNSDALRPRCSHVLFCTQHEAQPMTTMLNETRSIISFN